MLAGQTGSTIVYSGRLDAWSPEVNSSAPSKWAAAARWVVCHAFILHLGHVRRIHSEALCDGCSLASCVCTERLSECVCGLDLLPLGRPHHRFECHTSSWLLIKNPFRGLRISWSTFKAYLKKKKKKKLLSKVIWSYTLIVGHSDLLQVYYSFSKREK